MAKFAKFKSVKEWFVQVYLEKEYPNTHDPILGIDVDLDYFTFAPKIGTMESVSVAVSMLNELIDLAEQEKVLELIRPALMVPLKDYEKMVIIKSTEFTLTQKDLCTSSPPCLYFSDRGWSKYYSIEERYVCPIKLLPSLPIHKQCKVTFECARGCYSIKGGFPDFGRMIMISHYPDSLLLDWQRPYALEL